MRLFHCQEETFKQCSGKMGWSPFQSGQIAPKYFQSFLAPPWLPLEITKIIISESACQELLHPPCSTVANRFLDIFCNVNYFWDDDYNKDDIDECCNSSSHTPQLQPCPMAPLLPGGHPFFIYEFPFWCRKCVIVFAKAAFDHLACLEGHLFIPYSQS